MPPPPLSTVLVRFMYVVSWVVLAGSIFFAVASFWYLEVRKGDWGLNEIEKAYLIRMQENCFWADIGWLVFSATCYILLKATYFIVKGETQPGDRTLHDKFNSNSAAALVVIGVATLFALALVKG